MKTLKLLAAICVVMTFITSSHAQTLDVDFIEFVGRNVIVHYNLDDGGNSNRQFLVQLYSSQDNFTAPLTRVTGDYGSEVSAGIDKKIVWDITGELGSAYKGDIALELRGRVYVPFVKVQNINEGQVFKRGRNYPINWTSGNLSGQVNIELFNAEGERLWGENNVANICKFDWYVPGNVKKGNDYKLKFTNAKDRNDVVFSKSLAIKPRIPFWAKIGAFVIVGVGVQQILSRTGSSSEKDEPFPKPQDPPN